MAFRLFVLVSCLVASSYTAPAGQAHVFTQSIVQTPTSHSSQLLLVTPQLKESYKVQPQYVQPLSTLQFPREQLVYYYPPSYTTTYHNVGGPHLNLIPLRDEEEEELPWWQQFWNQITAGSEEEESPAEGGTSEAESPAESPADGKTPSDNIKPTVNQKNQDKKVEKPKKPVKHQMFKYKNQYYIVTGTPQFYGNFDAYKNPSSPFVSIQTLQPVYARSLKGDEEREPTSRISDDPSVAQASPQGIAIAGVGGVASSKPFAAAVVGDGGLAVASPHATAIAGNFFEEDEEEDKKKKD